MDTHWEIIEGWMHQYGDRLVRTLTIMTGSIEDAQDIAQETFIKAYRGQSTYRGIGNPYTYLYAAALNLVRSRYRRAWRMLPMGDMEPVSPYLEPDEHVQKLEEKHELLRGVAALSPKLREVISLHYLAGMSVEDMVEVIGAGIGTIKSRLFRAREELRKNLAGGQGYERN